MAISSRLSPTHTVTSATNAVRAGITTSAASVMVHAMNVSRDAALALAFGTAVTVDVFFLAMMIPTFVATVATGAYRNSIVPILERVIHTKGKSEAGHLITRLMTSNLPPIVVAVGLVLALLTPFYAPLLAGRIQEGSIALLTTLSWAVLPMMLLSAYAALAEGPLQTLGIYFWPTLFRSALPLGIAAGAVWLGPTYGIWGACYGGTLGALAQVVATSALLPRRPSQDELSSAHVPQIFREICQQFGLLSAGVALTYISPVIDQAMAAFLGSGAVSTLSYANRLVIGAASLAASALTPGLLPHFSRLRARGEVHQLDSHYIAALRITWWGGLALSGAIWILSEPFVALLYEHGSFTSQDSLAVSNTVGWLCLQFSPMLTGVVGSVLLSAVGMNKIFLPLSVLIATLNFLGNLILMPFLGLAGIALSTVLTYLASLGTINAVLIRQSIVKPRLVLLKDLAVSIATALTLATFLFIEDAKLSAIPTSKQLILSTLALGIYCGTAFLFTRTLFSQIRRSVSVSQ